MSDLTSLSLKSALITALSKLVKAQDAEIRADLTAAYVDTYLTTGVKSLDVLLAGKKVATATLSIPSEPDVAVVNPSAFRAWLREYHPEAFEMYQPEPVERVNPAWGSQFIDTLVETSDGCVDAIAGEVVPGIDRPRTPEPKSYSIKFAPGGAERLLTAWRQGALPAGPLALEAGDDDA